MYILHSILVYREPFLKNIYIYPDILINIKQKTENKIW